MIRHPPRSSLFPYASPFRSLAAVLGAVELDVEHVHRLLVLRVGVDAGVVPGALAQGALVVGLCPGTAAVDRMSTCLNSNNATISYAVFCMIKNQMSVQTLKT